jgi:sugar/nucleoside kinase (ribokinase family)
MKRILGMGNALVDIMVPLDNYDLLEQLDLPKGSMQLVDKLRSNQILAVLKDRKKSFSAGGSAANTIHGLATLGAQTGYIGVIGEDELGGSFVRDMINAGVDPHLIHSSEETGRAIALVTPDSERTFATFLGAAIELSAEHLRSSSSQSAVPGSQSEDGGRTTEDRRQKTESGGLTVLEGVFEGYDYFHIEGYLVQNHSLVEHAVKLAKKHGLTVSIDLASYNVVEANREFLRSIVEKYVDIVFANEEEAKAMTGKDPQGALHELGTLCAIAVVKTGSKGSLVKKGDETIGISAIKASPVDTTGAGDLYASGFLYGLSNGWMLDRCGNAGSLLAGNVIEVMGSKMNSQQWRDIRLALGIE